MIKYNSCHCKYNFFHSHGAESYGAFQLLGMTRHSSTENYSTIIVYSAHFSSVYSIYIHSIVNYANFFKYKNK